MLRAVHFLMALMVPFVLSALLGCIKAKEEPADLGPEVSPDSIDLALSKAINGAYLDPAVGQYTTYSITRRLETEEQVKVMGATKVEVMDKVEDPATPDEVKFNLRIIKSTLLPDYTSWETTQTEEPLILKKGNSTTAAVDSILAMHEKSNPAFRMRGPAIANSSGSVSAAAKPIRRSYHRLRETNAEIDPPQGIKNRPGCGGLSPCKIPVHYVQYDLVEWYSDSEFRKLNFDLGFSSATPYLPFGQRDSIDRFNGLLITNCVAFQAQVTGRTVFVRDCSSIEDLQK